MADNQLKHEKIESPSPIKKPENEVKKENIEKLDTVLENQETPKESEKEALKLPNKEELEQTGLVGSANINKLNKKRLKEIETILQNRLEELYSNLTDDQKEKFKKGGEIAAVKIQEILSNSNSKKRTIWKILFGWLIIFRIIFTWLGIINSGNESKKEMENQKKSKKIISVIKSWLNSIKMNNSFYVEQSAKIKADELIKITRSW